jgi:hypothetical protein
MEFKNKHNLSKAEQVAHLEEAWGNTIEAWSQLYAIDTSIGMGSPIERLRDDVNSISVRIVNLKKELLEDVSK